MRLEKHLQIVEMKKKKCDRPVLKVVATDLLILPESMRFILQPITEFCKNNKNI